MEGKEQRRDALCEAQGYLNVETGQRRNRKSIAIARVYLTSLIIELSFARRCFLSIRFDDCGETARRILSRDRALPVQFIAAALVGIPRMFANVVSLANERARLSMCRCIRECNHERKWYIIFSGYNDRTERNGCRSRLIDFTRIYQHWIIQIKVKTRK